MMAAYWYRPSRKFLTVQNAEASDLSASAGASSDRARPKKDFRIKKVILTPPKKEERWFHWPKRRHSSQSQDTRQATPLNDASRATTGREIGTNQLTTDCCLTTVGATYPPIPEEASSAESAGEARAEIVAFRQSEAGAVPGAVGNGAKLPPRPHLNGLRTLPMLKPSSSSRPDQWAQPLCTVSITANSAKEEQPSILLRGGSETASDVDVIGGSFFKKHEPDGVPEVTEHLADAAGGTVDSGVGLSDHIAQFAKSPGFTKHKRFVVTRVGHQDSVSPLTAAQTKHSGTPSIAGRDQILVKEAIDTAGASESKSSVKQGRFLITTGKENLKVSANVFDVEKKKAERQKSLQEGNKLTLESMNVAASKEQVQKTVPSCEWKPSLKRGRFSVSKAKEKFSEIPFSDFQNVKTEAQTQFSEGSEKIALSSFGPVSNDDSRPSLKRGRFMVTKAKESLEVSGDVFDVETPKIAEQKLITQEAEMTAESVVPEVSKQDGQKTAFDRMDDARPLKTMLPASHRSRFAITSVWNCCKLSRVGTVASLESSPSASFSAGTSSISPLVHDVAEGNGFIVVGGKNESVQMDSHRLVANTGLQHPTTFSNLSTSTSMLPSLSSRTVTAQPLKIRRNRSFVVTKVDESVVTASEDKESLWMEPQPRSRKLSTPPSLRGTEYATGVIGMAMPQPSVQIPLMELRASADLFGGGDAVVCSVPEEGIRATAQPTPYDTQPKPSSSSNILDRQVSGDSSMRSVSAEDYEKMKTEIVVVEEIVFGLCERLNGLEEKMRRFEVVFGAPRK